MSIYDVCRAFEAFEDWVVVAQASPMRALEALPIAVAQPWQDTFPGWHTCAAVDVAPILAASSTRLLRSLLTSHSTFYSSPSVLLSAKHQNPQTPSSASLFSYAHIT